MQLFIGTKLLHAKPMTLGEYNLLRDWIIPADEDPRAEGYLVEYADGGPPNHPDFAGYISWSPKEVFEESYQSVDGMSFSGALVMLKQGCKVARAGWNGKGMFIYLVDGSHFQVNRAPLLGIYEEGTEIDYRPHVDMKTVDGSCVPWVCSQSDMLADDWMVIE